jgi:hypothetical protein
MRMLHNNALKLTSRMWQDGFGLQLNAVLDGQEVRMSHRVVRVEPLPAVRIIGAMYFFLGVLFMAFFLFVALIQRTWDWSTIGFALAAPLIYGLMGVLVGGVGSWVYNILARWLGGLEIAVSASNASRSGSQER